MEPVAGLQHHIALDAGQLLAKGELAVLVDDDPAVREGLAAYFGSQGMPLETCADAAALRAFMDQRPGLALVLLDIGLPDQDGISLIPRILDRAPDAAVVMLTGVADLQVALDCIRQGAMDYLAKPSPAAEVFHVARKALERRRLILENRKYREELEEAHFRIQLLHQLSIKMNTVYLSTVELDEILRAILVGITAHEGLGFNRAFLAMFDKEGKVLRGRMAIGPSCREEAGRIWGDIRARNLDFLTIVHNMRELCNREDLPVNQIIRSLAVAADDHDHILIRAARSRCSIKVERENGCRPVLLASPGAIDYPGGSVGGELPVPVELIRMLGDDTFVVVPLFSPSQSFGVIIADNFITRRPILASHVSSLELFASQASLAIEQSHLYQAMQNKIAELQALNEELHRSKDLLVEAERYSALGQMAAQLVHTIRNPITSIGGVSRILARKTTDEGWLKYLNVIIKETGRLESTLEDLFDFVSQPAGERERVSLCALVHKSALLLQNVMERQGVRWELHCPDDEPQVLVDSRQIRQALLHLLKNGIEAMSGGGLLDITVQVRDNTIQVVVTDTGPGLPESQVQQAKNPFYTTKTYGTGMGLTLVEKAAQAHGGSFILRSRAQGGLEATLSLPLPPEGERR